MVSGSGVVAGAATSGAALGRRGLGRRAFGRRGLGLGRGFLFGQRTLARREDAGFALGRGQPRPAGAL